MNSQIASALAALARGGFAIAWTKLPWLTALIQPLRGQTTMGRRTWQGALRDTSLRDVTPRGSSGR